MSNQKETTKVPPVSKSQSPGHEWLYNKPALKTRTQPRFDPALYLNRPIPIPKPGKTKNWIAKKFAQNPRRFMIISTAGFVTAFYGGFIFDIFIFPAIDLAQQAKEAFLPSSLQNFTGTKGALSVVAEPAKPSDI